MEEVEHRVFEVRGTFPEILMYILNLADKDNAVAECISWNPAGTAFYVHNSELLEQTILPRFFPTAKYASFTRKLNRWGLKQMNDGTDEGGYKHPLFQRDKPNQCLNMEHKYKKQMRKSKEKKPTTAAAAAPVEKDLSESKVPPKRRREPSVERQRVFVSPETVGASEETRQPNVAQSQAMQHQSQMAQSLLDSMRSQPAGGGGVGYFGNFSLAAAATSEGAGIGGGPFQDTGVNGTRSRQSGVAKQRFVDQYLTKLRHNANPFHQFATDLQQPQLVRSSAFTNASMGQAVGLPTPFPSNNNALFLHQQRQEQVYNDVLMNHRHRNSLGRATDRNLMQSNVDAASQSLQRNSNSEGLDTEDSSRMTSNKNTKNGE
jgi:hypothetical protein